MVEIHGGLPEGDWRHVARAEMRVATASGRQSILAPKHRSKP